jgi:saccharopine dehydrogenase-like NADP-dependent oxidoreductase
MPNITIFGAGKSATICIEYLAQKAIDNHFTLTVVDINADLLHKKTKAFPHVHTTTIAIDEDHKRGEIVAQADIIISLLPPHLHYKLAKDCLLYSKHLITASYADDAMKQLHEEALVKQCCFLCEMGLDPGIDHMSAMEIIHRIKNNGGTIQQFESHCGGLIAPESDNNPWHYKISWNPKNVVLAGKAGALYLEEGTLKQITYENIFANAKTIQALNGRTYAWYPNRDSVSYSKLYDLESCNKFIRTTLRHPEFIEAWQILVQAQATNETLDQYNIQFLQTIQKKYPANTAIQYLLENIDMLTTPTPPFSKAIILQQLLENRLQLAPHDKDLVVMQHEITYTNKAQQTKKIKSFLEVQGVDAIRTAMAQTVGLPLALGALLILNKKITTYGVHIPIHKEIYEPVLAALANENIIFKEQEIVL